MRIALCQMNPTLGAIDRNLLTIMETIEKAKKAACELIIFPELALCGYFPDDLLLQSGFVESVGEALQKIIPITEGIAVIVGVVRKEGVDASRFDKPLKNSAAVIHNQKLLGFQDKMLLPTYDVFDERRYFQPASEQKVWDLEGKKIGITICEDIWLHSNGYSKERYQQDPINFFHDSPIDLLINISASPYALGKRQVREKMVKNLTKRLVCPVVFCNQVGIQDGLLFDGASFVINKKSELCFEAPIFETAFCELETDGFKKESEHIIGVENELFLALSFGVKEYFSKQGFTKALLGLSGGIDSSVVACIATHALGKKNVTGVLLPSRFTTKESREDALQLADNLGITTREISIEEAFTCCLTSLHPFFSKKEFDVTEENLQSRLRGLFLMALANKESALVLNTGNKSELAIGYSTLYGDSCGAISVIGDLYKGQVFEIARWIAKTWGSIPDTVLQKPPTAELRENQKDTDSLPDYSIVDLVVKEYVENQQSVPIIGKKWGIEVKTIEYIVSKIHSNEYKRRQTPFSIRVSEKNFSFGRKIPIVHNYDKYNIIYKK